MADDDDKTGGGFSLRIRLGDLLAIVAALGQAAIVIISIQGKLSDFQAEIGKQFSAIQSDQAVTKNEVSNLKDQIKELKETKAGGSSHH